jgi:hypothetical protein
MSMADATDAMRGDASAEDDATPPAKIDERPPPSSRLPGPSSSVPSAGWLLRAAAIAAGMAGLIGVIVAPGVRGNASESIVVALDWASGAFAVFLLLLLLALGIWGAIELLRAHTVSVATRTTLIFGGALVVAVSSYGLRDRVPPFFAGIITIGAVVTSIAAAYASAGAPHTRVSAALLFVLAFAAISRLGAWSLAIHAGDTASVRLFSMSRGLATAGVLFEAAGQLLAVVWLGTRSRGGGPGQLGSTLALGGAVALTWGVARGVHSDAELWQSVLHTALADAPGVPPPFGLDALATFLVPASLLLALAVAVQPRHGAGVLAALALALVSRGAFDAPLRALCAVVASFWAVLARGDEQAMWRALIREREVRIEDAGGVAKAPVRSANGAAAPPPSTDPAPPIRSAMRVETGKGSDPPGET